MPVSDFIGKIFASKRGNVIDQYNVTSFQLDELDTKVVGPASVTDGAAAAFDGVTGKLIKADTRLAANLVAGPSSATDNGIARYHETGGKTIQNSGVTIDDSNNLIIPANIYRVAWGAYTPTWDGFNPATPSDWAEAYYYRLGNLILLSFNFYGTSDDTNCTMTLPVDATSSPSYGAACTVWDNSTGITTAGWAKITGADVSRAYFHTNLNVGGWTASNKKGAYGQIWYMV